MNYISEKCIEPKTYLGRLWLKFKIKFLMKDDGESLICPKCGKRMWID